MQTLTPVRLLHQRRAFPQLVQGMSTDMRTVPSLPLLGSQSTPASARGSGGCRFSWAATRGHHRGNKYANQFSGCRGSLRTDTDLLHSSLVKFADEHVHSDDPSELIANSTFAAAARRSASRVPPQTFVHASEWSADRGRSSDPADRPVWPTLQCR